MKSISVIISESYVFTKTAQVFGFSAGNESSENQDYNRLHSAQAYFLKDALLIMHGYSIGIISASREMKLCYEQLSEIAGMNNAQAQCLFVDDCAALTTIAKTLFEGRTPARPAPVSQPT